MHFRCLDSFVPVSPPCVIISLCMFRHDVYLGYVLCGRQHHCCINTTGTGDRKYPLIAETIWLPLNDDDWHRYCRGSVVHRVCIVSSGDLHRLKHSTGQRFPLFHNKYSMAEDHTLMDCIEELLIERNKKEFVRDRCKALADRG